MNSKSLLFLSAFLLFPNTSNAAITVIADPVGEAVADRFGGAVHVGGDFNGDGFEDVLVGSSLNDAGGSNAGRVHVFFGGVEMDDIPDLVLTGEATNDLFGSSVSNAGDLNGDGSDDIIVGAPFHDAVTGVDAGKAYVYYGGPGLDNVADFFLVGVSAGDNFGSAVAGVGRVNGDAIDDVLVGAPGNDDAGRDMGRAYLFFGGTPPNTVPDVIYSGIELDGFLGQSLAGASDVNNDGFDDVIIGAPGREDFGFGSRVGHAFLFLGGASPNNVSDATMTEEAPEDNFGLSVSGAGDVNNDGFCDWIVGAPTNDTASRNAGRAYLYFGSAAPDNVADVFFNGDGREDRFGVAVSGGGDINGDGFSDILVGASKEDSGGLNAGRVYLYYGSMTPDNVSDMEFDGEAGGDDFGIRVSCGGNVNGGDDDFAVGAPLNDNGGADAGRAYIYSGDSPPVPVTLTSFGVRSTSEGPLIYWSVAEPMDQLFFVVHVERDGSRIPIGPRHMGDRAFEFVDQTQQSTSATYWLAETSRSGEVAWHGPLNWSGSITPTALAPPVANPNPFHASTEIMFNTVTDGYVQLEVFDTRGRRVRTLEAGHLPSGSHSAFWDGRLGSGGSAANGLYFVRLRVEDQESVGKLLLMPKR